MFSCRLIRKRRANIYPNASWPCELNKTRIFVPTEKFIDHWRCVVFTIIHSNCEAKKNIRQTMMIRFEELIFTLKSNCSKLLTKSAEDGQRRRAAAIFALSNRWNAKCPVDHCFLFKFLLADNLKRLSKRNLYAVRCAKLRDFWRLFITTKEGWTFVDVPRLLTDVSALSKVD